MLYASPFHSLSIYPLHLYLSLPLYISPSNFLSLFSLSFSLAYLMDVFVLVTLPMMHYKSICTSEILNTPIEHQLFNYKIPFRILYLTSKIRMDILYRKNQILKYTFLIWMSEVQFTIKCTSKVKHALIKAKMIRNCPLRLEIRSEILHLLTNL